jgi:hypothetical protein
MEHSRDKSLFLRRERNVWDHLVEEARLRSELVVQLTATCQRVVELVPATREVANR